MTTALDLRRCPKCCEPFARRTTICRRCTFPPRKAMTMVAEGFLMSALFDHMQEHAGRALGVIPLRPHRPNPALTALSATILAENDDSERAQSLSLLGLLMAAVGAAEAKKNKPEEP